MVLSHALVERLTPPIAPGEDDFLKDKLTKETSRQRRLAWTRYLRTEEFFYKQIAPALPKGILPWHVGVGLVPTLGFSIEVPKTMASAVEESGYTWGVILALEPFASASAIQTTLDFQRRKFPIIASPSTVQLHDLTLGSTHNSAIGSRTTWATARQVTRQGASSPASAEGLLTARHVPDNAGQTTLWSSEAGCPYSVHRKGSTYVDAVYLEGNWGTNNPAATTPKSVDQIAAGDGVDLRGAYSSFSCFVTHTPNPNYIGGGSPSHVFLDKSGVSGDSGGLVRDVADVISMYVGETTMKDGSTEGLSLALEQIVDDLEIDILI